MPEIKFPSRFLKAEDNIDHGENITFVDTGKHDEDERWIFKVRIPSGEVKLFSLNKRNFDSIRKIYGSNSDNWVGKQMTVRIVDVENPKTGEMVKGIRLVGPGLVEDGVEDER